METDVSHETALVYAYKTRNAGELGINPNEIRLGYQVHGFLASHQCDFGKDFTSFMLKNFKTTGGIIKVINKDSDLVIPLPEYKILIPVPEKMLEEWGLTALLN